MSSEENLQQNDKLCEEKKETQNIETFTKEEENELIEQIKFYDNVMQEESSQNSDETSEVYIYIIISSYIISVYSYIGLM